MNVHVSDSIEIIILLGPFKKNFLKKYKKTVITKISIAYLFKDNFPIDSFWFQDVILCSGGCCALDISIMALCSPGQNILIPRPGFPLYQTLAHGLGIITKSYDLLVICFVTLFHII